MTSALALLLAGALTAAAAGPQQPIRRFALVAGANDGGSSRVKLRYASSDAESFSTVLETLGGIAPRDRVLLREPGRVDLLGGLAQMRKLLEAARGSSARIELVVYYSGHSDDEGLLLGGERVGYRELRGELEKLPADVRIAILDSCSSGALIRAKGGKHVPPFLIDSSSAVRGHAYLTATSAEEAAQESDKIQGSYFTYALLTGLRGAADTSRDGKVTLSEAYQFAFDETLSRTESSRAGPQHPAWDLQLAGTGDVVLTDLRGSSAGLVLGEELAGRLYLRDANGRLVAELRKMPGVPVELGLEPGTYQVTLEATGASSGSVELVDGKKTRLLASQLVAAAPDAVLVRGSEPEPIAAPPRMAPAERRTVPVNLSVWSPLSINGSESRQVRNYFGFHLAYGESGQLHGVEIGLGFNRVHESLRGLQIAALVNQVEAGEAVGAQVAGVVNTSFARTVGAQIGGLNIVEGELRGIQFGYVGNRVYADGAVFQVGGLGNQVGGAMKGAQVAGATNVALNGVRGTQVSGLMNLAVGPLAGAQVSGLLNVAQGVRGAQIGTLNLALGETQENRGAQIGVLNVAGKLRGLQLGVINIAEEADATIGVINIVRNGYFALSLWADEAALTNVGVKMGGRRIYTMLSVGARPTNDPIQWSSGGAIGWHWERGKFHLDSELFVQSFKEFENWESQPAVHGAIRFVGGWQLLPQVALIGGPTVNTLVSLEGRDHDFALGPQKVWRSADGQRTVRLYPGLMLGVQVL